MPYYVSFDRKLLAEGHRAKVTENERLDDMLGLHVLVNALSGWRLLATEVTEVRTFVI